MSELEARIAALPEAALRSWAITMTRAVMALSVILSHWGPGVFERLGVGRQAEAVLALFYRMGTPGFAAVFGIGIGYFMLPNFSRRRGSVLRRMGRSFQLVMIGLTMLAAIRLGYGLSPLTRPPADAAALVEAVAGVWGADRVGVHLAPRGDSHDMGDSDARALFTYVARSMRQRAPPVFTKRMVAWPRGFSPRNT